MPCFGAENSNTSSGKGGEDRAYSRMDQVRVDYTVRERPLLIRKSCAVSNPGVSRLDVFPVVVHRRQRLRFATGQIRVDAEITFVAHFQVGQPFHGCDVRGTDTNPVCHVSKFAPTGHTSFFYVIAHIMRRSSPTRRQHLSIPSRTSMQGYWNDETVKRIMLSLAHARGGTKLPRYRHSAARRMK